MDKNFIRTTDEKIKDELISKGYQLVHSDNHSWTFINDKSKPMTFSGEGKVTFTNILNV